MRKKILLVVFGMILLGVFLILVDQLNLNHSFLGKKEGIKKIKVAATIFPLFDIARQIGRDRIEVIQLLGASVNVHNFEINPQKAFELQGVKLIFKIGYGLDDWVSQLVNSVALGAKIVDVSKGVRIRHFPNGMPDPHYWLDLKNAYLIASNIADYFALIDAENRNFYWRNLEIYKIRLSAAGREIENRLANLKSRKIATFHNGWGYFADAYNLEIVSAFQQNSEHQPSFKYLFNFIKNVNEGGVRIIFIEPRFPAETTWQLAKDLGLEMITINPLDGGWDKDSDFIEIMLDNARKIEEINNFY